MHPACVSRHAAPSQVRVQNQVVFLSKACPEAQLTMLEERDTDSPFLRPFVVQMRPRVGLPFRYVGQDIRGWSSGPRDAYD